MLGAILGNYRITTQISGGGMGSVYRAQHALLERPAAVKLLRPELTANDELRQRFFNEAQAATKIRHPGIVEIYDFGYTDDGLAYLVMELLDGAPLSKRLAERGRFSAVEAAYLARGIASALRAAHGKGIVHRDLKPDNVFLVPDSDTPTGVRIKILDFGIAKLVDALPGRERHTQTGALIGTPIYMAPEQARTARTIDHRADLYSLGCVLYEMLVGAPPFVAEGAGEIIAMHLFTPPEPPSTRAPVGAALDAVVLRLLAKEPHERFGSAQEVIEALDGACGLTPQVSGPFAAVAPVAPSGGLRLTLIEETAAPAPEKRSSLGLIAVLITLLIVGAVAVVVATRGDDAPAQPQQPPPGRPGIEAHEVQPPPPPPPSNPPEPSPQPQPAPIKRHPPKRAAPPESGGPVTRPSQAKGPTTANGSPIETTLDDGKPGGGD